MEEVGCGDTTALMRVAERANVEDAATEEVTEEPMAAEAAPATASRPRSRGRGRVPEEALALHEQGQGSLEAGGLILAIEQLREARRICKEANVKPGNRVMMSIDADLARAYTLHGRGAFDQGDIRRARIDFTHAYHYDSSNTGARAGLMELKTRCSEAFQSGYVYETGHHLLDRAAKYYREAMAVCPDVDGFGLEKRQEAESRLAAMEGGGA